MNANRRESGGDGFRKMILGGSGFNISWEVGWISGNSRLFAVFLPELGLRLVSGCEAEIGGKRLWISRG